jgi:hypothetical protein
MEDAGNGLPLTSNGRPLCGTGNSEATLTENLSAIRGDASIVVGRADHTGNRRTRQRARFRPKLT